MLPMEMVQVVLCPMSSTVWAQLMAWTTRSWLTIPRRVNTVSLLPLLFS